MEDEDREELEDLKTEVGELNRRLSEYESPAYARWKQKPSKAWAVLGLLTVMGLGFLLIFIGIPPFIAGIAAVFIGGFLARRAGAGALIGFLGVFLPLFTVGLMLFLAIGSGEGLAGLAGILLGAVGLVMMIAGTILGLIGAGIAAVAGAISSKVWKYKQMMQSRV